MNRGVMESSPVQHLTADGNPNWWNNVVSGGLKPLPPFMSHQPPSSTSYLLPSLLPNFFPSPTTSSSPSLPSPLICNPNLSSWLETTDLPLDQPWSLSQLLWGGVMMGEDERMEMMNHHHHHHHHHHHQNQQLSSYQEKKLEIVQEQVLRNHASMKQQSNNNNDYVIMSSPKSTPNKSCLTETTKTTHNTNQDNNNNGLSLTTEYNNSEIGVSCFANKKPKLQVSSSNLTLKVRKEKIGGRIAALHQLVSPFGKTDTASVLSEAIGYIRFLHNQIEALSLPYFGTPSRKNIMQQHALGDMNGIFPEDPGQLVNEYCMKISKGVSSSSSSSTDKIQESKNKEDNGNKELRSRGLCLVPISCTLQVATDDNGADYWAPPFGITFR